MEAALRRTLSELFCFRENFELGIGGSERALIRKVHVYHANVLFVPSKNSRRSEIMALQFFAPNAKTAGHRNEFQTDDARPCFRPEN